MQKDHLLDKPANITLQRNKSDKHQAYIHAWKNSGLSMSDFCRQHDLPISSFSGWAKKSKASEELFKPCVTSTPAITHDNMDIIEISFKDSVKIRFSNSSNLSLVLRIAKELAACS